jgi:hypothetical protein
MPVYNDPIILRQLLRDCGLPVSKLEDLIRRITTSKVDLSPAKIQSLGSAIAVRGLDDSALQGLPKEFRNDLIQRPIGSVLPKDPFKLDPDPKPVPPPGRGRRGEQLIFKVGGKVIKKVQLP